MINLRHHITSFFTLVGEDKVEIYNEFSVQHELGIHLRRSLGTHLKVQYERPVSFFGLAKHAFEKREIDIAVFSPDHSEKYAIELKYPRSGQHPEQMFKACQDIRFLEQLCDSGFTTCFFVMVSDDRLFYEGGTIKNGIYLFSEPACP